MIDALAALGPFSVRAPGAAPAAGTAPLPGAAASFADALGAAGAEALQTMRNAESVSISGLKGEADARVVVDAVMQAEQTLQTAVALRDKIVSAYLEISRMQI